MRLPRLLLAAAALATVTRAAPAPQPLDPLFAAAQGDTRAALLIRDGRVVAKRYAAGYGDGNRFISWSMAKTVTAMLVGFLVEDGRLQLDAPAPIAEWQRPGDPRARITLRELLQMRSGLRHLEVGEPIENSDTNQTLFVSGTGNMAPRAIAQPLASPPGRDFNYSSLTSIILAELVTRTLTPSTDPRVRAVAYRRFAEERLFGPAGIRGAVLEFDGAGTQIGGSLIYMPLDDWGRIGRLLLDGRAEDGRQVVSAQWLAAMTTPSPANGGYGLQTWLNRPSGKAGDALLFPGARADARAAQGHLAQHVAAVPSQRVVLVRLGHTPESEFRRTNEAIGQVLGSLR